MLVLPGIRLEHLAAHWRATVLAGACAAVAGGRQRRRLLAISLFTSQLHQQQLAWVGQAAVLALPVPP
jgi:hypothetical protein